MPVKFEYQQKPAEIADGLRRFRRSAKILSSSRKHLIKDYDGKWVAVYEGDVKLAAKTLPELLRRMDEQGISRRDSIVRFIERDRRTLILLKV